MRSQRTNIEVFWAIFCTLFRCFSLGAKRFDWKNDFYLTVRLLGLLAAYFLAISAPWPEILSVPFLIRYLIWDYLVFAITLIVIGLGEYCQLICYEQGLKDAGILNTKGRPPGVKSFKKYVDKGLSLYLDAWGINPKVFQEKSKIIESIFNLHFHEIKDTDLPRYKELWLTSKNLPKTFYFKDAIRHIKAPYQVVIGMSAHGRILSDLSEWPHGLIAGSTGSGKSVQMKSIIAQFIYSTKNSNARVILCDLKGGVEFSSFKGIKKVQTYSTIHHISHVLQKVVQDMEDRFKLMKKEGVQKIIPKKHKRDFIFIAIDESSLLYRKAPKDHPDYKSIESARIATQKILKLGRAARISVLFGLQRPSKESIDTEIQENIDARMCLKINTIEGSIRMLGHKKGVELPAIPGRGIWKLGNSEEVFQAPFISNEDINKLKSSSGESTDKGENEKKQQSRTDKTKANLDLIPPKCKVTKDKTGRKNL